MTQELLDAPTLADELRVSVACLERMRQEGRGPDYIRVGRLIRYPRDAVNEWLTARTVRRGVGRTRSDTAAERGVA